MSGKTEIKPVLDLRDVRKSFRGHLGIGKKEILRGLSLSVRPGEVFGLLGPNGAGKTTTLKLILGLLRVDSGSIEIWGEPPRNAEVRDRIGFLPENPYFYDYLTARELLDLYARLHGFSRSERQDRVERALLRVGMAGRADTPMRKFSKGMIQRIGLAQAIQHDPDLLIFDEPMSGLDPIGRREVRDLILELREEGRTIFFSSHILQDAEQICDRAMILKEGKSIFTGDLSDLVDRKVQSIEVGLRGTASVEGLPCEPISSHDDGVLVRVADAGALEPLLREATARGFSIESVWPRKDTLEDIFLREIAR